MRHGAIQLARCSLTARCRLVSHLPTRPRWSSTSATPSSSLVGARQWSTPLANTIAAAIEATGPISIAAYMRQCLTSDQGGYYTTTRSSVSSTSTTATDQFGTKGDFITSPEISQVFGELVGIWFMTEWLAQGRKKQGVQLIELGPGRGTLMDDMLRTIAQFKVFAGAIEAVWMVEASAELRQKQQQALCGEGAEMRAVSRSVRDGGQWESTSKYASVPVRWVEDVSLLPADSSKEKIPFIVAHEFFDALPIHAFESVAPTPEQETTQLLDQAGAPVRRSSASRTPQWRELLVTPTKRKFTVQNVEAKASKDPSPDFQLSLAKASTPTSLIMPERPRYQRLKPQVGSRIEVSPESFRYVEDLARRIGGSESTSKGRQSGAALIIDYGPLDTVPINSLRGIKAHKIISPFTTPGEADISADVDFTALADAAIDASAGVEVYGPVEQGAWLTQLGIEARVGQLLKNVKDEQKRKEVESGWKRLVEGGPRGMGKAYKCMAILPENGGRRRPVGFGGGVVA